MQKINYILRAREDNGALAAFRASIRDDPAIELVNAIGPDAHPHTLIVAVAPEQASVFEQRLRALPHLIFERDRKLSLFD